MSRSSSTRSNDTKEAWGCLISGVLGLAAICPILILLLVAHTPRQPTQHTSSTWDLLKLAGFMLFVKLGIGGGSAFSRRLNAVLVSDQNVLGNIVFLLLSAAEGVVGFFALLYWKYSQLHPGAFDTGRTGVTALSKIDALYFALTTFTTTGYGDVRPLTDTARLFVSLQMAMGFLVVVLGATLLIGRVLPVIIEKDQMGRFLNMFQGAGADVEIKKGEKEDPK